MADLPPNRGSDPGTPRWVKVFGLIAFVVVLLFVVVVIFGGGEHGPGRHTGSEPNTISDPSRGHTGPPLGVTHDE